MTPVLPADAGRNVRAWQRRTAPDAPGLRIAVLASFTADPLVPHLGTPLDDAGAEPEVFLGPFNQIAQECLRDDSATACFTPDAVVVCARPEDRPATGAARGDSAGPEGPEGPGGDPRDLERLAATALDAARRWGALLVWVLPPLPCTPSRGVDDSGDPRGAAARAVASREAVRARLADDPHACVVDLEDAVRTVGVRHASHPALFRLARVPFTEDVFFRLGGELARVLLARHGQGCHGVLADLDGLVLGPAAPPGEDVAAQLTAELAAALEELPPQRPLAYRTGRRAEEARRALAALAPELARVPAEWIAEGRTVAEDVAAFAAARGVTASTVAVLTGPRAPETKAGEAKAGQPPGRIVVCEGSADRARLGLLDAGAFDLVPPVTAHPGDAPTDTRPAATDDAAGAGDDYAAFLRDLGVRAHLTEHDGQDIAAESDVADRAHDFTLALPHAPERFTTAAGAGRLLLSARVSDRYGDYGTAAVIGVRIAEGAWHVELFSVSCVVMGKGVEDVLLRSLVDRAAERGAAELVFHYRDTGRNHPAVAFLRAAAGPHRAHGGGEVRVTSADDIPSPADDDHRADSAGDHHDGPGGAHD
ncbi:hypothetical protein [Streptomyces sp. Rer75]|uniref:hypothetical protein n=1 Tax=Streptomyces sp. Rer75 TaxID=2750011 RepID=UPI0015CFF702|nr:hypothetical protein [Streptomyces sp. Rer75]QLH25628.1 hypothetical protein HYQ63_37640 [Streptomyces sp. Rer75]